MKRTLKKTQRLRVIVDGISFYTTVRQVYEGVGDQSLMNIALQKAVYELAKLTILGATGLVGFWEGFHIQVNRI